MKRILSVLLFLSVLTAGAQPQFGRPQNPDGPFKISIGECAHGSISVSPSIEAGGTEFPKGTVLHVTATPDPGYAFECGYFAQNGIFAFYDEYATREFEVTVTGPGTVGGSFVEPEILQGYTCKQDIVYAQPGVKPLKYDAFIPDGAKNLPGIVIIHGGGWRMNCEDVMKGLARELVKDGRYVAFSIDYRWIGTADGDGTPNTMKQLIEDCYGAILHIQEHAAEYGLDPRRLAVTGDSAGGHLCASVANMIENVGSYFIPTYIPERMSVKKARKNLLAIKAVAPNYGIFSVSNIRFFVNDLSEEEQHAVSPIDNIPDPKVRRIPQWINRGTEDTTVNDEATVEYFNALKKAGQEAYYFRIEGAQHAYYDWKPDSVTKSTFRKFGAPAARQMLDFYDSVFYTSN